MQRKGDNLGDVRWYHHLHPCLLEARNTKVDIQVPEVVKDVNRQPHRVVAVRIFTAPVAHIIVASAAVLQPDLGRVMVEPKPVRRKLRNRIPFVRESVDRAKK